MRKILFIFPVLLLFSSFAAHAEFYSYTDENGVTRYRDDSLPMTSESQPDEAPALESLAPITPPPSKDSAEAAPADIPTLAPVCLISPEELEKLSARKEKLDKEISFVSACYRDARKGMDEQRKAELRQQLLNLHFESAALEKSVREKNGGTLPPGWEE